MTEDIVVLTKGEQVKLGIEEAWSPAQRASLRVHIVKDSRGLTKLRITRKIQGRSGGGTGSIAGP